MPSATVIAVDDAREVFVLQAETGECAVCWVLYGPVIRTGDVLTGHMRRKGFFEFQHAQGNCWATGESGLVTRREALLLLHDGREVPFPAGASQAAPQAERQVV